MTVAIPADLLAGGKAGRLPSKRAPSKQAYIQAMNPLDPMTGLTGRLPSKRAGTMVVRPLSRGSDSSPGGAGSPGSGSRPATPTRMAGNMIAGTAGGRPQGRPHRSKSFSGAFGAQIREALDKEDRPGSNGGTVSWEAQTLADLRRRSSVASLDHPAVSAAVAKHGSSLQKRKTFSEQLTRRTSFNLQDISSRPVSRQTLDMGSLPTSAAGGDSGEGGAETPMSRTPVASRSASKQSNGGGLRRMSTVTLSTELKEETLSMPLGFVSKMAKAIKKLASQLNMPYAETYRAVMMFARFVDAKSGDDLSDFTMDKDSFHACLQCMMSSNGIKDDLREDIEQRCFRQCDVDGGGDISVTEFAVWFSSEAFTQSFNIKDDEQEIRNLARKFDIAATDIDRYKMAFDKYDEDSSGLIDYDEFHALIGQLLKVPKNAEIPLTRIKHLWAMADTDGSGEIDFEEFVEFYRKYFDDSGDTEVDPLYDFYQSVRRISKVEITKKR
eukprot:TRINITY_DN7303_c0_g1_i1.p1 TRINITY_DN7303_c0_g1~~TRINITY_DN7303_c0_g1_i1.p1  ORF type:complete len:496 (+),score=104.70 TRINITY_DN7303_c0_g1_i1:80-1567(+)